MTPTVPEGKPETHEEPEGHEEVPPLVPARMVNEYTYCPRLFYLEWVENRFADNDDTVQGRYVHRVADEERGRAPLPDEGDLRQARSLSLSSARLGLTGRLDVVEGDLGVVRPVDYKKGSPPPDGGVWPSDEVQLCVQGLLLREHGYTCISADVYYNSTRTRVTVELTDELVQRTLKTVEELREAAARTSAPLPLVDSPKCPRCSLVGLCLPDETNMLLARSEHQPRRLVPRDPDHRPMYVLEQGAYVGVRRGRVEVTRKRELVTSSRIIDVSQVNLHGNVQVSTQALREFFARDLPVFWFSYGGWLQGTASGLPSKHVELRRRQVTAAAHRGPAIARAMVEGKIRNARTLLRRNARIIPTKAIETLKKLAESARTAQTTATLLGIEGAAARIYFEHLPAMIRPEPDGLGNTFSFEGRNRRPPRDPVNALLSFVYALLVKDLLAVILGTGMDPYLGMYHRPRFGRPALALDLAEEFRPLIGDSVVIAAINNGEVKPSDFVTRAGGVALTIDGRRKVIQAYERRLDLSVTHPVFGYQISYRRVLDVQTRMLAAHVLDELPDYTAFTTR